MARALPIFGLLLVALLIPSASAQEVDVPFYLTDDPVTVNGVTGETLSVIEPTGSVSKMFSAVPGVGVASSSWYTGGAFPADMEIGTTTLQLELSSAVEVLGSVTATLVAVGPNGATTVLGSASDAAAVSALGRTVMLSITPSAILTAGSALGLTVSVDGVAEVAVALQYNDGSSLITSMPLSVLDSDGDGFGDTAERLAGTDPFDATDHPGGAPPLTEDDDGEDDDGIVEPLVAAGLLLATLAVAGYALLGRFRA